MLSIKVGQFRGRGDPAYPAEEFKFNLFPIMNS